MNRCGLFRDGIMGIRWMERGASADARRRNLSLTLAVVLVLFAGQANGQRPNDALGSAKPEFDGFLEAEMDAEVAAGVTGIVRRIAVSEGDFVEEGQALAVLDETVQQIALSAARTAAEADGAIGAAEAEHQRLAERLKDLRSLQREQFVRPDEIERAETELLVAAKRWQMAIEERALRQRELERAELELERRTIRAPFAGLVAKVHRTIGEFVSPTEPSILRLITADRLEATSSIPVDLAAGLKVGDTVTVRTHFPPIPVRAKIVEISPIIDRESATFEVRARIEQHVEMLRVGDNCSMVLTGNRSRQARDMPEARRASR